MPHNADPIKVYDARWEANDFTRGEIGRLIESLLVYGCELGADSITIARDARLGSGSVMEQALELSLRSGFRVFLCPDPISTTQSYFMTAQLAARGFRPVGLTVTASHNPAAYTGLKVTVPPLQAIGLDCGPSGGLTRVRRIYHGPEALPTRGGGTLELVDATEPYISSCVEAAGVTEGSLEGLQVVLDSMNGSAGPVLYTALRRCGADVEAQRLIPDGTFPTGSPNPTSRGKMDRAVTLAGRRPGALVIGTDGDGDRLVFGDHRGLLNAGFVAVPVLEAAMRCSDAAGRTCVLHDPKVNPVALREWSRLGVQPALFRNGHSQIKERMQALEALAAVEESGHYYHGMHLGNSAVYCENSLLTVLLFLGALRRQPHLLDRLWTLQEQVFCTGELNFRLSDDAARDTAMDQVVGWFERDGARISSRAADGADLQGTIIRKGVGCEADACALRADWYSGYLRAATNEKAVLRFYLSAGGARLARHLEAVVRQTVDRLGAEEIE